VKECVLAQVSFRHSVLAPLDELSGFDSHSADTGHTRV